MKKIIMLSVLGFALSTGAFAADRLRTTSAAPATSAPVTSDSSSSGMSWLSTGATKGIYFSLPNGGDAQIGYTVFWDQNTSMRLGFGLDLNKYQPEGVWGVSIDFGYRVYIKGMNQLKLYYQPDLLVAKKAANGDFGTNLVIAPAFGIGAEYYFAPSFSMGVGTGVSLTFANNFNNIRFTTGTTAITGNFYW